jgi:hypothetical protein
MISSFSSHSPKYPRPFTEANCDAAMMRMCEYDGPIVMNRSFVPLDDNRMHVYIHQTSPQPDIDAFLHWLAQSFPDHSLADDFNIVYVSPEEYPNMEVQGSQLYLQSSIDLTPAQKKLNQFMIEMQKRVDAKGESLCSNRYNNYE